MDLPATIQLCKYSLAAKICINKSYPWMNLIHRRTKLPGSALSNPLEEENSPNLETHALFLGTAWLIDSPKKRNVIFWVLCGQATFYGALWRVETLAGR